MESTVIEDSQQTFIKTSYSGIEIIVRKSDGYVNATKMVVTLKKSERSRIESLFKSKNWIDFFDYFKQEIAKDSSAKILAVDYYEQINKYSVDYRGWYVHPKLINYIAFWASPKYAYTVTQIMDKINERIQLSHQLDDTTSMAVHADIVFNQELEEKEIINNQLRQQLNNKQQDLTAAGVPIHHETQYILFLEQTSVDDGYITYSIRKQDKSGMSPYRLQRLKNESVLFFDNLPIAMSQGQELVTAINQNFETKVKNNKIRVLNTDRVKDILFNFIRQTIEQLRR
ncbi:MAG: hypothetical protein EZS28_005244 [Streblomastix strix]|uniref:KilA-N domain-containing protein n=1 Tax=Streblomastix strix TaxID=222440 RepID=A0A5J4WXM4_9EUKA|nr:MAG: hypothetical protein EZS28_005244 [Streblomastix strix]